MREPAAVRSSVHLYRFLVNLYPSPFRLQYGDLMVQVFRDSCLQASHADNRTGLLPLWGRTLADTVLSVIEQYSNRGAVMTKKSWLKLSGWLMAASGLFFLAGWLAGSRPEYNAYQYISWPIDRFLNLSTIPLMLMGAVCFSLGILGLMTRFGRQAGGLGQSGLTLSLAGSCAALVGTLGLSLSDTSPWWETAMLGQTGLFLGLILFGIRCRQLKLFSRWNNLPLLTGMLWPLLVLFDVLFKLATNAETEIPGAVIGIFLSVAFGGVGLLGYLLQADVDRPGLNQADPWDG